MQPEQLYEGRYLRILWNEKSRIIGIDWKEATSIMTSEEFEADLTLFATHVEMKKATGIFGGCEQVPTQNGAGSATVAREEHFHALQRGRRAAFRISFSSWRTNPSDDESSGCELLVEFLRTAGAVYVTCAGFVGFRQSSTAIDDK